MNYYGKDQCLHMDWKNTKRISTEELAYCIDKYNLDTDKIPEARHDAVFKKLTKIRAEEDKRKERKLIETELAIYETIIDPNSFIDRSGDEIVDYYLDPDLFETAEEAIEAMAELHSCFNWEITKTEEYNHQYKDPNTYARDINRMKKNMQTLRKQYIKLGGSEKDFDIGISKIPLPTNKSLKEASSSSMRATSSMSPCM